MNRVEPECTGVLRMSKKEPRHSRSKEPEEIDLPSLVRRIADIHYHLVGRATKAVNVSLTLRNWLIGLSIQNYELKGKDGAAYGDRLFSKFAQDLTSRGVSNCSLRQLYHYRDFYLAYPHIVGSQDPQLQDLAPPKKGSIAGNERVPKETDKTIYMIPLVTHAYSSMKPARSRFHINMGCPFEAIA